MKKLLEKVKVAFRTPDVRRKLLITFIILVVFRLLAVIPVPGVPVDILEQFFKSPAGGFFNFVDIFTGGTLRNFSIISIGLGAYINASVIFQLLGTVIKKIEELQKEGESGRRIINQWTRLLTVPLAALQSLGIYTVLKNVKPLSPIELAGIVCVMTAGAIILMWLGELLTEDGIGNGISLLIMAGIVTGIPNSIGSGVFSGESGRKALFIIVGLTVFIIILLVVLNEATRKVEVQFAQRIRGGRMLGGSSSYLPLKILQAGVMPIIFASSVLLLPLTIAHFVSQAGVKSRSLYNIAVWVSTNLSTDTLIYIVANFVLVIVFAYFYAFVVFRPDDIADNLKKQGGFIPGIRPGTQTAEYLTLVMSRLNFIGALVLAAMATLPFLVQQISTFSTILSGGTSILILVSVILETKRSLDAMLVTRSYEGFLR